MVEKGRKEAMDIAKVRDYNENIRNFFEGKDSCFLR